MSKMFPPTDGMDPKMAGFIEEMRKEMFGDGGYTYLDFYMGTGAVSGRKSTFRKPIWRGCGS